MQPKVSVLMPAHNAAATVAAAIESILKQTLAELELVAVDDGSTDDTPDILDSLSRRDQRVRVIHADHGGIIPALNTGIAACEADFIARMDADDISHPRRLELQADLMDTRPDVSVCSCLIRMFPRASLLGGMVRYEQWLNSLTDHEEIARDIFVESPIAHPSAMVRRRELIEMGGYQERGWAEDYDLWLRYHASGRRFEKVPRMLLCWRQLEGRLTFTDSRYSVENFLRAKAHYLARMLSPSLHADMTSPSLHTDMTSPSLRRRGPGGGIILWGAGKTGRRIIKHLVREGVDIEAVIDIDSKKIGRSLRGRPIVSYEYLQGRKDVFVIAAVSSHGARELIREQLRGTGLVEVRDFVCAA